ncbi:hypothetical protein [Nocardia amamiensis]|uniref:hypothetical protein n=1 Tax=Nocardia amamiensis TaxID=404578 RepID=UPI0012F4D6A3|nr:hypothetical protein [Nocardia amamiensis]
MPMRQVVVILCVVVVVLCLLIDVIFGTNYEYDLERRLRYQECVTQERARIAARGGSLLQPEDFCDLYPGR